MKYQIEFYPNPDVVGIHVDKRLIQGSLVGFPERSWDKEKLSEPVRSFCAVASELDGIVESVCLGTVVLDRYEIRLCKSRIFSWNDILPHVLEAMKVFLADGDLQEKAPPIRPQQASRITAGEAEFTGSDKGDWN